MFLISLLSFQVLVAILPDKQMQYFDVEEKTWKPMASLGLATGTVDLRYVDCAKTIGRKLFVAGWDRDFGQCISCYDMEQKVWEKHRHPFQKNLRPMHCR